MRRGRRFVLPEGIVFVLAKPGEASRFGVVTPKRVGNAVQRHAVARRVRHSWLPLLAEHPEGFWLVVRADAGSDELNLDAWIEAGRRAIAKVAEK